MCLLLFVGINWKYFIKLDEFELNWVFCKALTIQWIPHYLSKQIFGNLAISKINFRIPCYPNTKIGNDRNCKKLKEIKCNRADSINSSITTQFRHSKPLLFPLLLLFPFLANIHEYQKEAHVLKIDFLYHVTYSVLCGNDNWTTHHLQ